MGALANIERMAPNAVVANLKSDNASNSAQAGKDLVRKARDMNLSLRDYLTLVADPRKGDAETQAKYKGLNGYEACLMELNLPVQDDLSEGIMLEAASDTFQTYAGTRAMFPEVMDDVLRYTTQQDQIENIDALISQSRTISGNEMVSTVVDIPADQLGTFTVPEMARVPVRDVRTTETSVKMFKHGSAYRTSYEFNRRARLDIMTPFAARVARELELSKVKAATSILINGDGVNAAAPTEAITDHGGDAAKSLSENYKALAKFVMSRAKEGLPVDTVVGNYDMFAEFLFMYAPTKNPESDINVMKQHGTPIVDLSSMPILGGAVKFALSSSMAAGQLLFFSKAETMEELVEAGSSIAENDQAILNQTITYVRTQVSGFKLNFGDTRVILDTTS